MKIWNITIFGLVVLVAVALWMNYIGFSADQPGSFYNTGNNAVWIGHEWVGETKTDDEIFALATELTSHDIGTVFVHSGPFEEDGTVVEQSYDNALNFLEKMDKFAPDIEVQAWLGQVRSKIDLDDEEVRENVADQCMILGMMVGFDGIHLDIEPVWDEDYGFIQVLKACSEALPEDKKLSVALAEFIPKKFIWLTKKLHEFENYNTEVNYKNVGEYADQIVVMAYDTDFKANWLYAWLVREQLIWVTDLYADKDVFIGIPAYDEGDEFFDPEAENVESGLKGIIDGLNNSRSREENFEGVAVYSLWEMDEEEWATYDKLWLDD